MTYEPEPQKTLLIPSGTYESPDKKHLFVIMTEVDKEAQLLLLSVSSIKPGIWYDPTCVLEPGCHEFITMPSFVFYTKATTVRQKGLIKCVDGWLYTPKERLDNAVFARMCEGVEASPHTPRWAKKYFAENRG